MSITLSCLPDGAGRGTTRGDRVPGPEWLPSMIPMGSGDQPSAEERDRVDTLLLGQIAGGDREAFGQLYDRFSGPLYSAALHILQDATEAQDIVHDAFISLWEKAATFDRSRGSAFSWAVTLVRNRAIDRVRMRRRRAELLADSLPEDLGYAPGADNAGADEAAEHGDTARIVRAAVATLPPEQQRALELAFFGGLTQEEIARILREPLGTIKARIRRGLLRLREALSHQL